MFLYNYLLKAGRTLAKEWRPRNEGRKASIGRSWGHWQLIGRKAEDIPLACSTKVYRVNQFKFQIGSTKLDIKLSEGVYCEILNENTKFKLIVIFLGCSTENYQSSKDLQVITYYIDRSVFRSTWISSMIYSICAQSEMSNHLI